MLILERERHALHTLRSTRASVNVEQLDRFERLPRRADEHLLERRVRHVLRYEERKITTHRWEFTRQVGGGCARRALDRVEQRHEQMHGRLDLPFPKQRRRQRPRPSYA